VKPQRNLLVVIVGVIALALGAALGWYAGSKSSGDVQSPDTASSGRKVLYWHDPMVPGPKFDKPGKSPFMDMELVPVYADEAANTQGPPIVSVRPEIMNSLGVRTASVARDKTGALIVPREALIRTGTRTAVVAWLGEGRFRPIDVVAGPESGDNVVIAKGLAVGDRVVVSGQFLIDSEASTRASFQRMEPAAEGAEKKP
jgi:hypothetical protein